MAVKFTYIERFKTLPTTRTHKDMPRCEANRLIATKTSATLCPFPIYDNRSFSFLSDTNFSGNSFVKASPPKIAGIAERGKYLKIKFRFSEDAVRKSSRSTGNEPIAICQNKIMNFVFDDKEAPPKSEAIALMPIVVMIKR